MGNLGWQDPDPRTRQIHPGGDPQPNSRGCQLEEEHECLSHHEVTGSRGDQPGSKLCETDGAC